MCVFCACVIHDTDCYCCCCCCVGARTYVRNNFDEATMLRLCEIGSVNVNFRYVFVCGGIDEIVRSTYRHLYILLTTTAKAAAAAVTSTATMTTITIPNRKHILTECTNE